MKLAAVCSTGLGSSFMVDMNMADILKELGVNDVETTHMDMWSASPEAADHFFVVRDLADAAQERLGKDNVTVLTSIIDKDELKKRIVELLKKENVI